MQRFFGFHNSLSLRLIFWLGVILIISFTAWSFLHIKYEKKREMENIVLGANRLSNAIKLGTNFAMSLNSRDHISQVINSISQQEGVENIRIFNNRGEIKYSNRIEELNKPTDIQAAACQVCHATDPPLLKVDLMKRTRVFKSSEGYRVLGIISPIYNEPSCAAVDCHDSPEKRKVLGGLDVVVSLKELDKSFIFREGGTIAFAIIIFLVTSAIIGLVVMKFVNRPIKQIISATGEIGKGLYGNKIETNRNDEIGELARAVNNMGKQIGEKQEELNKQKEEYRNLFENSPCYITVQDKNFRLLRYNREFAEYFEPEPGDYCYQAYKGRSERCEICPVLGTFEDGKPRTSEETGINRDGTKSYWMVRTSPIKDSAGEVVAAMEMSLDVTHLKFLESEVRKSEQKYRTIFNTIFNPIFVVDRKSLEILDCNDSVTSAYGYEKNEVLNKSFLDFFNEEDRDKYVEELKNKKSLNNIKHDRKNNESIYVNIYISPSEYMGREVLIVTTNDITDRLLAERQLIQASKMATLGQMATGIAHELNQPLSVIKTACGFLLKKVNNKEPVKDSIMEELASEMDSHVDRASKIINHLREFGRQSEAKRTTVQINEVLEKALEIFNQQLKLREIGVETDLDKDLPPILADPNRLEQVFINLLTNARDAIESRGERTEGGSWSKKITIKTWLDKENIFIEVSDTGTGIPESIRDKIYDPFFTTKQVGKGTGLGLSISYGIVQDYGGTIRCESREGEGAIFIIQFPISRTIL